MGDDAGGVVDEADEIGLDGFAAQAGVQIGAVEGVGLPEVVGVGFGEGEAGFGAVFAKGREQVEFFHDAAEGVRSDALALEQSAADAFTIDDGDVARLAVEGWENDFDGRGELLGHDLAGGAFVAAFGGCGDAISAIVVPPGLDGAPGELAGGAFLILEDHLANSLVAGLHGVARGVFECAEHPHFQIVGDAFHVTRATIPESLGRDASPFGVAARNRREHGMRHDVKSEIVRPGSVAGTLRRRAGWDVFSGCDRDLEAVLEGGGRTGAGRKGRVEMAEMEGVRFPVGFPRWSGQHAKPGEQGCA